MYLTVEEVAQYLEISVSQVTNLIYQKKIRAVYDGESYLIYKEQFNNHFEQIKKYKEMLDEFQSKPIPEDIDIKDED